MKRTIRREERDNIECFQPGNPTYATISTHESLDVSAQPWAATPHCPGLTMYGFRTQVSQYNDVPPM